MMPLFNLYCMGWGMEDGEWGNGGEWGDGGWGMGMGDGDGGWGMGGMGVTGRTYIIIRRLRGFYTFFFTILFSFLKYSHVFHKCIAQDLSVNPILHARMYILLCSS